MVALVSGSNLGLFNHLVLGNGAGSKVGQGNNQVFLNAATGNLILQQHSNELPALGLDTQLTQTYNSQGQHNDARSQSWLLNQHRYLTDLPEKATVGSKLRRANGDGSFSEYHFDSEKQAYISTDGSGAHDQIRFDEAKKLWIWQEGTSGVVEHYNSDGQLVSRNDRDGHLLNFSYENNLLSRITDASGQQTTLSYIQVSGKTLLSQIATSYVNDQGKTQETINQRFEYDLQGRLSAVIIDLTPEDNTIADGNIFRTDYQYDGNSLRIKQVEQSDGVIQQFTYKKMGEQYRIVRIEDGKGVGVTLDYNTTQRLTTVRNDKGETSFYRFDEQDRLTSITQPAVNHQRPVLSYTYDDAGNITSVTDAKNQVTQRQYDDAGNLLTEIIGNQVNYFRYNENNQIIAKANYTLAKPGTIDDIGHLADLPENAAITRMVYDQQGHLRYTISAEGRIQAWDYNAQGLMVEHRVYSNVQFSLADYTAEKNISLSAIDTFLNAQPQAQYQRTTNDYDARGMVARITQWTGNQAQQKTHYIYSAFGQLLKTINDKGVVEQFTYDGLGRVLSKEKAGQRLSTVQYNDAQQAIVTTTANGLSTTQVFDSAGRLVTESTVATDETVTGKQRLFYDEAGRLVAKEAADGARSYLFYNEAGRKAGTIDETGKVTRFSYDANGLLIATREYSTRVDTSALVAQQGEVNLKLMKLTAWLPAESAADRSSYAIYDAQGREQYAIDTEGFVTETIYNAQGKQVAKHRYEQPLSSEQLTDAANYSAGDINRLIGSYSYVLMDNTTWTTDRQPDQPYAYTSSALLQHRELHAYEDVLKLSGERVNRNPVQPYPVQTGYDYTLRSVQKAGAQTLQLVGARTSEQPMVKVEGQAQPTASPAISLALTREGALAKLTLLSTEFSANKSNAADYWQGDQRFIKPTDRGFEITQPGRKNTASAVKSNSSSRYLTAKGYHFKTDVTLSDTTGLFSLAIKADNRKQHMLRLISGNTVALIGLGAGGVERQLNKEPYTKGETYTIEFEVNADSSTVYFYPKGKTRAEGFSQRLENHGFKSVNVELIVGKSRTNNDQRVDLTHFQEKGQLALDNYQLRYRVAGTENFTPVSLNEEQEFAWNDWPDGQAYELELTDKETGKVYLAQTTGTAETLQFKPEQDNTAPSTSGVFINNMVPKGQWAHYQQITTKVFNAEGQLVGEGTISPADFAEYQGQIKIGDQLLSAGQYQLEIIFTDNTGKQLAPLSMGYQVGNTHTPLQQSLQWASPKQAGELDVLRVRKVGSNDWQTLTITQDAQGKNKADLTPLTPGQYEYQINYLNDQGQISYQLTGSIDTNRSSDTTHSGITNVEAEAENITYQQVHNKYDVLQGVISTEEQQNLEKIDCNTYRKDGRHPLAENTITIDDWVNFKGDVTLLPHHVNNRPLLKNGEAYRVEINLHYKDGSVVTKAPIEFEFGDDFYTVNQTLRWPVVETHIPFTERHEFRYRVNGSKDEFISVPVVREGDEFVVQLTGLIPGEGYEYRIKHLDDQSAHIGGGEYDVELWGLFSAKLGQSTKDSNVSYDRIISEPADSGALTGVISAEEAKLIDSVDVSVRQEQADGSEETLSRAETYISSYKNYQGEVNLGMPGGLKPGKYTIVVQKFYRNGEVKHERFDYEVGAQPQLNKTHRLRIPVANLPVDINQPNVQLSYRLKQLGEAFTAIDVNSIRSSDGQYLELNLDQSREAAYDFDLKIVSDQGEFQGRASVILDANTDGNYLLKFGDKLGNDIAGRFTHRLYSQDGLLVGELDAEGFLVEHRYDAAGQKISTTRYANATGYPSKQQLFLDINTLRPEVSVNDQTTHFIYDDLGQHIATVDAEGYLTETVYDSLGQVVQIIGYRQRINYQQQTLTELRVLATGSEPNRVEHHEYDDRGRLIKQTAANGLVTHNEYDVMGNLITVTQGQASDHSQVRYQTKRYDQLGRVTAELTATGAKQLAAATTDAEREIIWQKQATLFSYNERGWLISKTYPEVNALENGQNKSHSQHLTQWFFYNKGGQLRFSISSQGAVNELRYNTLGEKIASIDYATALPINNALTGGLASTELSEKIKGIANSEQDQVTHFEYNKRGLLAKSTTASGSVSQYQYNSFGEVSQLAKSIQAANKQFQIASFEYDLRGLAITKTLSVEGLTESGLRQTETITYDAFQRKTKVQQGEFICQQFSYNRLNQLVSELNAAGDTTQVAYDAFGRKVSITDRQGNTTTYHYDDQQHQLKVVSATGEQLITQYDQFGEKAALIDAVGTRTEYHYDEAGRVQQVTQHSADGELLKTVEQHEYNTLGWKQKTVAANGLVTTYQYDVAGKLLRQTVDPEGKAQVTSHEVDVRGRVIKTTTPNGVQTLTAYDAEGRVSQITRQAGEQQRITRYRYDEQGNKVAEQTYSASVVNGQQRGLKLWRETHYHYDGLGRLQAKIVDPSGLAQTTRYQYDEQNNLTAETNSLGQTTYHAYNTDNQRIYSVDAEGGVTLVKYTKTGQVWLTEQLAKPINTEGLELALKQAREPRVVIEQRITDRSSPQQTEHNHRSYTLYDADGRKAMTIDNLGGVTEFVYNSRGALAQTIRYTQRLSDIQQLAEAQDLAATKAQVRAATTDDKPAYTQTTLFDQLGQARFMVDANGSLTEKQYDISGQVVRELKYDLAAVEALKLDKVNLLELSDQQLEAKLQAWLTASETTESGETVEHQLNYQQTDYIYNQLGQTCFTIDAAGYINRLSYDQAGQVVASYRYQQPLSSDLRQGGRLGQPLALAQLTEYVAEHNATVEAKQYVYDAAGRKQFEIDSMGYVTAFSYDALDQLLSTTRYTQPISYDPSPTEASVNQATQKLHGVSTRQHYDALGHTLLEIDALGHVTGHEYDALGQLRRTVRYAQALDEGLRNGSASEIAARLSGLSHAQDQATVYRYDAAGHKTALITGAASAVTLGLSEDQLQAGLASGQLRAEFYEYDALGQRTVLRQATAEGDFRTLFYYDSKGQLTRELKQVNAEQGYLTVFDYDAFGNKVFENRYSGLLPMALGANQSRSLVYADRIVRFRYDALNRLVAETVPSADGNGHETQYQYDAFGNLTLKTEAAGMQAERRTAYRYDERNQKIAEITALGTEAAAETQYRYDALGRVSAIIDARGVALVQDDSDWALAERARLGIVNTITTADGQTQPGGAKRAHELTEEDIATLQAAYTSEQTFDAAGRKIAERDPLGHETHTVYDAFGNIIKATDPRGQVGYFFYDANNRLRLQIDPKGYATETRYDAFGQVVSTYQYQQALDLSGGAITEQSDLTALISQLQTQMGSGSGSASDKVIVQQHTLNAFGQILSSTQAGVTTTFSYDAQGNKVSATDGNGHTTHYAYDAQGRLIEETSPEVRVVTDVEQGVVSTQVVVTRHQYDQLGNKTQTIVGANSDQPRVTEFRYNAQGQLIQQR
ncbi:RHS repeat protein, partial [Zooshikella ganghwensis]|uniref:RHS repeat protein n=2 Tax=Zooshikella ganghwensis TaxID=202772 RepID=UPI001BB08850